MSRTQAPGSQTGGSGNLGYHIKLAGAQRGILILGVEHYNTHHALDTGNYWLEVTQHQSLLHSPLWHYNFVKLGIRTKEAMNS